MDFGQVWEVLTIENPKYQLGAGCLIDQLVGQMTAHVVGLGHILEKKHVRKTLESILKYNRKNGFNDHFNPMRSYVFGKEIAILMASYPKGGRPEIPFPYFGEVMTGFEHSLAAHLVYEGMQDEALEVVRNIRSRYDGKYRNPFSEAECGHHYARAMASWATFIAWTGFRYSGVNGAFRVNFFGEPTFWSSGSAWGTFHVIKAKGKDKLILKVVHGKIRIEEVEVIGVGIWQGVSESIEGYIEKEYNLK